MEFKHISVLLNETIDALRIRPDGIYFDGTLGGAGHSSQILKQLEDGLLIAMDRDEAALMASKDKLREIGGNFVLAKGNFLNVDLLLGELQIEQLDGALLDLGVSSHQLDTEERGFSYHYDAPLDMRMDQSQKLDARTIVNTYSHEELTTILLEYGEERWAKRIAEIMIERRPIETTFELVDVIKRAVPAGARDNKHPARRTFQALRIAVNHELDNIEATLDKIMASLAPGGRLAVITFHSLEDRIVKNTFRRYENPCSCPAELPLCVCGQQPTGKLINRKPIIPGIKELEFNPRSRSAKLRVIEKI
ncbi:MAG TPA: 16S rRNA (cytosine(1402)-N(4))-methyltransferase RsmH [Tissierellia bacterium]|nr:16S rRNA (cytosine(1402)-N(4))-methyltransferase RsmH [Tissierellia bacterium]